MSAMNTPSREPAATPPRQIVNPTTNQPATASGQLPLEAQIERSAGLHAAGWTIQLPIRAEHLTIEKQSVVYEQVTVRRGQIHEVQQIDASIRRERLRV